MGTYGESCLKSISIRMCQNILRSCFIYALLKHANEPVFTNSKQGVSLTYSFWAWLLSGCTDPSAANYNPSATNDDGSCTFVFEDAGKEIELSGTLHDYVTSALRSLWGAAPHLCTVYACSFLQGRVATEQHVTHFASGW